MLPFLRSLKEDNEELNKELTTRKKLGEQLRDSMQMERDELSFLLEDSGPEVVHRALTELPKALLRCSISEVGCIAVPVSSDPEVTGFLVHAVICALTICCLGEAECSEN